MKKKKLLDRFLSVPADFTWNELTALLFFLGYIEIKKGKTAGSRRKYIDRNNHLLLLHKPHPGNVVKKYAIAQVIETLKETGKLND